MPDLIHSLQGRDLGFLRIVSLLWGIELDAPDAHTALPLLVDTMLDAQVVKEVVETLPPEAQTAIAALLQAEGRVPWAAFARRFGSIREMGAGRRDRERPYLAPISPAEILWYRALIARDFFDTASEPEEFVYIPDDLIPLLPSSGANSESPPGRPASPGECSHPHPVNDRILDHSCTLLAGLRLGFDCGEVPLPASPAPPVVLQSLMRDAGLLDAQGLPLPEPTRAFLEAERGEALALLAQAWMESTRFNELRLLPGLKFEGEWSNNPRQTRQFILNLLSTLPEGTWWSLPAFVSSIRERYPDFQRPAGDYDSWFIRRADSDEYLRGYAHWEEVDGALVRYLICSPMHWLGFVELAAPTPEAEPAAFRFSPWAPDLLEGLSPGGFAKENGPLKISADGRLHLSLSTPRALRYQIARFSAWEPETSQEYRYRLTPASLERARSQGLRVSHLLALLRRHTEKPLPPSLVQALERWDQQGTQARLEQVLVLRLGSPDILTALRRSRAARFLGDPLGPTTVIIKPGAQEKVLAALADLGYLAEVDFAGPSGSIMIGDSS